MSFEFSSKDIAFYWFFAHSLTISCRISNILMPIDGVRPYESIDTCPVKMRKDMTE